MADIESVTSHSISFVMMPCLYLFSLKSRSLLGLIVGVATPVEEPQLWRTTGKAYNTWICALVHSLIEYTDDQILR